MKSARILPTSPAAIRSMVLRQPAVAAVRRSAAVGAAPVLRRALSRTDCRGRFLWARRIVPGSLGQIPDEIVGFGEFAAATAPERICEIGTLYGGTSLFLSNLSPSVRSFTGIDLKLRNDGLVRSLAPVEVEMTFLEGSTRDPGIRDQLVRSLDGEPLDLLFIDGDHAYEGVRADLLEYRGLVRSGGLIAFHDIVPHRGRVEGPVVGLNWAGDVPRLWEELRDRFRHREFIRDPDQDGFGIGVIEHDPDVAL